MAIYTRDTMVSPLTKYGIVESNMTNEFDIIVESERVYNILMNDVGYLNEDGNGGGLKGFIQKVKDFFIWLGNKIREMFAKFINLFRSKRKEIQKSIDSSSKPVNASTDLIEGLHEDSESEHSSLSPMKSSYFPCTIEYEGYEIYEDEMKQVIDNLKKSNINDYIDIIFKGKTPYEYLDKLIEYDKNKNSFDSDFKEQLKGLISSESPYHHATTDQLRGYVYNGTLKKPMTREELEEEMITSNKKTIKETFNSISDLNSREKELDKIEKLSEESVKVTNEFIKRINNDLDRFLKYGNYKFNDNANEVIAKAIVGNSSNLYKQMGGIMNELCNLTIQCAKITINQVYMVMSKIKNAKIEAKSVKEGFLSNYLESVKF